MTTIAQMLAGHEYGCKAMIPGYPCNCRGREGRELVARAQRLAAGMMFDIDLAREHFRFVCAHLTRDHSCDERDAHKLMSQCWDALTAAWQRLQELRRLLGTEEEVRP